MNHAPSAPLSEEERALAVRLGHGGRGPAPDVDARILAAAHAAVAARPAPGVATPPAHRRRRRWPVALGMAATLVLAVGLGWQMRPRESTVEAYSEAPAAAGPTGAAAPPPAIAAQTEVAAAAPPTASTSETPGIQAQAELPVAQTPSPRRPSSREAAAPEAPAATASATDDAIVQPEATPAPAVARDDAPAAFPGAAPATPAAPPAPPPPAVPAAPAMAPVTGNTRSVAAPAPAAIESRAAGTPVEPAKARMLPAAVPVATQAAAASDDALLDERPPITTGSTEMRQAWLVRIRSLLAQGRIADARASIAEFQRRYPDAALPDDLRPLAEPRPAP